MNEIVYVVIHESESRYDDNAFAVLGVFKKEQDAKNQLEDYAREYLQDAAEPDEDFTSVSFSEIERELESLGIFVRIEKHYLL